MSAEVEATQSAGPVVGTVVVVGASRGLGLGVARQFLQRGWDVVVTARDTSASVLAELASAHPDRVRLVQVDITRQEDIAKLKASLAGPIDVLYVNAGITDVDVPVGQVPTDVFENVMVTNALSPMRVVEEVGPCVADDGAIVVVSSRQGSISLNTRGGHEVYRASKSALNQLMRSYAARDQHGRRTLLLLHPGWVKTGLGGAGAQLSVEQSVEGMVTVVEAHRHDGTLQFLDYTGQVVPW